VEKIFIYWDNSNIFISSQSVAEMREGFGARSRFRVHFHNLLELARAGREVVHALAVGSIPPELRAVWNALENEGVQVSLQERGQLQGTEQGVDQELQVQMLRDLADNNGAPGIAVLLTGDGSGFETGAGFHADLKRMKGKGWGIEVLSWRHSCSARMRHWAEENGVFIPLDDYYGAITFLEPPSAGQPIAQARYPEPLNLGVRPMNSPSKI
jgi:hypothetical protein